MNSSEQLFNDIKEFIEQNKSLLNGGMNADLSGLDTQVETLCAAVMQLSPEDREKYADSLQYLFDELTVLGKELTIHKDALAHEMRYLSSHKKASVAYQVADAKAKPPATNEDD